MRVGKLTTLSAGSGSPFLELYDEGSNSAIFIYNRVEYVGYMTEKTKQRRVNLYKSPNFGGATGWAVDLDVDTGLGSGSNGDAVHIDTPVYTHQSIGCAAPCTIVLAPSPLSSSRVIYIPQYKTSLQVSTSCRSPRAIWAAGRVQNRLPISSRRGASPQRGLIQLGLLPRPSRSSRLRQTRKNVCQNHPVTNQLDEDDDEEVALVPCNI